MVKGKNDFLEGAILPSLMRFSIPVLLSLVLQALYGAVDLWTVGKFGTTADISAVSTGSQVMQIVIGAVTSLSVGTTVFIGQRIGNGDYERAAKTIGTSIWIFGVLGVFLTAIMVLCVPGICELMNTPREAFSQTYHYILICSCGNICIVAYNLLSAIFRGIGDSKSPLLFAAIACVVNIAGDIVLIKFFRLGAAGAAIATIFAQMISVILSGFLIKKKKLAVPVERRHLVFHKQTAICVLRMGIPIALQDFGINISFLILAGLINALGVTISAGVGIAEKIIVFNLMIPTAYMQSISAFVAQNIGAGNHKRARRAMWIGLKSAAVLGGITACILFFHGDVLSTLFMNNTDTAESQAVLTVSANYLKATAIEGFLTALFSCFSGYFNGCGKNVLVMVQGLCSTFLVRIPYAWYASRKPEPEVFQIAMSAVYAAAFALILYIVYYLFTEGVFSGKRKAV